MLVEHVGRAFAFDTVVIRRWLVIVEEAGLFIFFVIINKAGEGVGEFRVML